ncbi:uncharacterized protein LOC130625108 [Hydractinia symbiolongicarpus]|uniref:uncharacterized protein LOC130625108 n=1 Tax=Hydractinia symbiolongicarpus TaxID=13093 RepID=UPI00254FD519|nr:uncharacterized protein LOC130625108 [Hydractinia symbiolongicarpus]
MQLHNALYERFTKANPQYFDYVIKVLLKEAIALMYGKVANLSRMEVDSSIGKYSKLYFSRDEEMNESTSDEETSSKTFKDMVLEGLKRREKRLEPAANLIGPSETMRKKQCREVSLKDTRSHGKNGSGSSEPYNANSEKEHSPTTNPRYLNEAISRKQSSTILVGVIEAIPSASLLRITDGTTKAAMLQFPTDYHHLVGNIQSGDLLLVVGVFFDENRVGRMKKSSKISKFSVSSKPFPNEWNKNVSVDRLERLHGYLVNTYEILVPVSQQSSWEILLLEEEDPVFCKVVVETEKEPDTVKEHDLNSSTSEYAPTLSSDEEALNALICSAPYC